MPDRLEVLHREIDDLTDPDGEYAVVCPLSGKRPVPVRGKSFPTAEVAADAVDFVIEYRKLLREVDPHLENIPIVACEESAESLSLAVASENGVGEARKRTDERDRADERGRDRPHDERERADERDRRRGRASDGRSRARDSAATVTLSGDGDDEWLRLTDAPVVHIREDGEPLDDAVIGLELNSKL